MVAYRKSLCGDRFAAGEVEREEVCRTSTSSTPESADVIRLPRDRVQGCGRCRCVCATTATSTSATRPSQGARQPAGQHPSGGTTSHRWPDRPIHVGRKDQSGSIPIRLVVRGRTRSRSAVAPWTSASRFGGVEILDELPTGLPLSRQLPNAQSHARGAGGTSGDAFHSDRKATAGASRTARRAGIQQASHATLPCAMTIPTKKAMSASTTSYVG